MVLSRQPYDEAHASHRLPGLPADLRAVYEGLARLGATGPGSGRDIKSLAKQLHMSKHNMEHGLHVLEGKGIAGHQTSGRETTWYVRK